ncbi:MAG: hypothetical protein P8N14_06725 [Sulfitobacter sp.]|nr:hypothetical protein [Sulfitobacter sp.]
MTNRLALILAFMITIAFVADIMWFGKEHMIFLGKKMFEMIEWMAFWR